VVNKEVKAACDVLTRVANLVDNHVNKDAACLCFCLIRCLSTWLTIRWLSRHLDYPGMHRQYEQVPALRVLRALQTTVTIDWWARGLSGRERYMLKSLSACPSVED